MDVVQVSWTVDADLAAAVKVRAASEALPASRVVSRLLRSALELGPAEARQDAILPERVGGASSVTLADIPGLVRGSEVAPPARVPDGVNPDTGEIEDTFNAEPFEDAP